MNTSRLIVLLLIVFTFQSCDRGYQEIDGQWFYVTIDEGHGRREKPLTVDAATFQVLSNSDFAKDKDRVFLRGRVLEGVDAASFRLFPSGFYAMDRQKAYFVTLEVPDADIATFTEIKFPYAKDKNFIYCGNIPITPNRGQEVKVRRGSQGYTITSLESFIRDNEDFSFLVETGIDAVGYGFDGQARIGEERYEGYRKVEE